MVSCAIVCSLFLLHFMAGINFHRSFSFIISSAELDCRSLQLLINAVEKSFPQAKRQALLREYKQRMLQFRRAARRQNRSTKENDTASTSSDSDETVPSFVNLPNECMDIILRQLDPISLAAASCTCHSWHFAATKNELWQPLLRLTFGSAASPTNSPTNEPACDLNTLYYKRFCTLASQHSACLLPWTSDRITCHGLGVRWIAQQTRDRVMASPGPAGVAWNRSLGIAFMTPDEVVIWLNSRTPKWLSTRMTLWRRREQERLRTQRNQR